MVIAPPTLPPPVLPPPPMPPMPTGSSSSSSNALPLLPPPLVSVPLPTEELLPPPPTPPSLPPPLPVITTENTVKASEEEKSVPDAPVVVPTPPTVLPPPSLPPPSESVPSVTNESSVTITESVPVTAVVPSEVHSSVPTEILASEATSTVPETVVSTIPDVPVVTVSEVVAVVPSSETTVHVIELQAPVEEESVKIVDTAPVAHDTTTVTTENVPPPSVPLDESPSNTETVTKQPPLSIVEKIVHVAETISIEENNNSVTVVEPVAEAKELPKESLVTNNNTVGETPPVKEETQAPVTAEKEVTVVPSVPIVPETTTGTADVSVKVETTTPSTVETPTTESAETTKDIEPSLVTVEKESIKVQPQVEEESKPVVSTQDVSSVAKDEPKSAAIEESVKVTAPTVVVGEPTKEPVEENEVPVKVASSVSVPIVPPPSITTTDTTISSTPVEMVSVDEPDHDTVASTSVPVPSTETVPTTVEELIFALHEARAERDASRILHEELLGDNIRLIQQIKELKEVLQMARQQIRNNNNYTPSSPPSVTGVTSPVHSTMNPAPNTTVTVPSPPSLTSPRTSRSRGKLPFGTTSLATLTSLSQPKARNPSPTKISWNASTVPAPVVPVAASSVPPPAKKVASNHSLSATERKELRQTIDTLLQRSRELRAQEIQVQSTLAIGTGSIESLNLAIETESSRTAYPDDHPLLQLVETLQILNAEHAQVRRQIAAASDRLRSYDASASSSSTRTGSPPPKALASPSPVTLLTSPPSSSASAVLSSPTTEGPAASVPTTDKSIRKVRKARSPSFRTVRSSTNDAVSTTTMTGGSVTLTQTTTKSNRSPLTQKEAAIVARLTSPRASKPHVERTTGHQLFNSLYASQNVPKVSSSSPSTVAPVTVATIETVPKEEVTSKSETVPVNTESVDNLTLNELSTPPPSTTTTVATE